MALTKPEDNKPEDFDPKALAAKHHVPRKHHDDHEEEEHEEGEPWLMSYADMMTLLFCFFVIISSFGNYDPIDVAKKSKEVADYTSHGAVTEEEENVTKLEQDVSSNPELQGIATASVKDGSMEVVFSSTVLFPNGGVELEKRFYQNIDILIGLIKNRNSNYRVIVEGHTDLNDSYRAPNGEKFSSWQLSAARASKVIDRFIYQGFKSNQVVAIGYGDSRLTAPSFDKDGIPIEENRALNRRVVIKVLQPMRGTRIKKMKMENYFEDSEILEEVSQ